METILIYIVKATISLTLFYVAYKTLLAKETFFDLNRIVLLLGIAASLCLPLIQIEISNTSSIVPQTMSKIENIVFETNAISHNIYLENEDKHADNELHDENVTLPSFNQTDESASLDKVTISIPWLKVLAVLYFLGVVLNLIALIISYFRIMKLAKRGNCRKYNGIIYCVVDENISPFSWGKYVVISKNEKEIEAIITHETAHIKRQHFLDILFTEIALAFHWFNPFACKLKQELKDIHEFQADSDVLKSGIDASKYQLLILEKAVGTSSYALANSFNHSKIKKRITMMLKQKSKSWNRLKILFLIPLASMAVYTFSCTKVNSKGKSIENLLESETITPQEDSIRRAFHSPILEKDVKRVTGYGMRIGPIYGDSKLHPGVDYVVPEGSTVYAIKDGEVVEETTTRGGYGKIVKIAHGNDVETWYAHNSENLVKKGDKVKMGQAIALSGNTGKSAGPHLHFEMRVLGTPINPANKRIMDWKTNMLQEEFVNFFSKENNTLAHPMPTYNREPYGYGMQNDPLTGNIRMHHGLDIPGNAGDTIYALKKGIVMEKEMSKTGYGKMLILQHWDEMETKYAHCNELLVQLGDIVNAGQAIALVGNTGKATGPHLHFELRINGELQDPSELIHSIPRKMPISTNLDSMKYAKKKYKVCIDPGHGGKDPGAISNGIKEKDINLLIAQKLQKKLNTNSRLGTIMTRSDDTFTSLELRNTIANQYDSDLFISLHLGSTTNEQTEKSGMVCYISQTGQKLEESNEIALKIIAELHKTDGIKIESLPKTANFQTLRDAPYSAIYIELAYINNPNDLEYISDNKNQEQIAEAVYTAILKTIPYGTPIN